MQDRPDAKDKTLYDLDFYRWCHEQAALVRAGRFAELDLENVAEELETLGRSDKHHILDILEVLVAFLLMWKYLPGARMPGWRGMIRHQRDELAQIVADSPSLVSFPGEVALECYNAGRLRASEETGIDFSLFPDLCPFTAEQVIDPDFLPQEMGLDGQR